MDWISNLFIALFFTDITGTLFFLIGLVFRKILFRHDAKSLRFLVITTLCAYTMPVVYFVLYSEERLTAVLNVKSNVNLFYNTPRTSELFSMLGIIWIVMFFILLGYRLYRGCSLIAICRGNIPVEDEMLEQRFLDISAELGIEGKVSLCWNDSVNVPCITYWHGPVVILPLVRYTEKEADVILYHELCHYLDRDVPVKAWSILVTLIHGFNPAAYILLKQADLVCEEYCDRIACEKGKELFSTGDYFRVIYDLLLTDGKRDRYQLFALVDTKSNYERRVKIMNEYHVHGSMKRGAAFILSACFLVGSSITALAAGNELSDAYMDMADETSEKASEFSISDADHQAMEELCRIYDLDPEKVVMMGNDDIEPYGHTFTVEWTVPVDRTYMTSGFNESEGDEVSVTVAALPEDLTYQTGIKDPEQIMRYVEGEGTIFHTFDIVLNGRYYFFVTNLSETEELDIAAFIVK